MLTVKEQFLFSCILLKEYPDKVPKLWLSSQTSVTFLKEGRGWTLLAVNFSGCDQAKEPSIESHRTEISACDFYLCSLEKYLMSNPSRL